MATLSPDAERFLSSWMNGMLGTELVEIRSLRRGDGPPIPQAWTSSLSETLAAAARALEHGDDVYIGAQPRARRGGRASDVGELRWLVADLDVGTEGHANRGRFATRELALAAIEAFPIEPQVVVDTGGGFHVWWRLQEPAPLDAWQDAIVRLAHAIGGDPSVTDAPRILRLPGTLNFKYAPPRPVVLVRAREATVPLASFLALPASPTAARRFRVAESAHASSQGTFTRANDTPIALVFDRLGLATHHEGERLYAACPVHGGTNTRQMVVGGQRNVATCFGDCAGKAYTPIDVVVAVRACKPMEAAHWITGDQPSGRHTRAPAIDLVASGGHGQPRADDDTIAVCSDLGNARRFLELHGADVRHVPEWDKWLVWDGRRFRVDDLGLALQRATATTRTLLVEARAARAAIADDDKVARRAADRRLAWAESSQNAARIAALLRAASGLPGVALSYEQLDRHAMLLNVANGTLDLATGSLRPHDRAALLSKCTSVVYDEQATAPQWEAFLARCMGQDVELLDYVQRLVGYFLTGSVAEQCLAFTFGNGSNGKSTFALVLQALLGEYAVTTPRNLLFAQRGGDQHPTELAGLRGARLAVCAEVPNDRLLDEAKVKDLTGGDRITARRMNQDFWSFDPTHKLLMYGNHKPRITGTDDGIWRRVRLIPWTVVIPENERVADLPDRLREELPGILAWAVRGCLAWQERRLGAPIAVRDATADYRHESDPVAEFFELRCVFEPDGRVTRKMLRGVYEEFCEENGITHPLDARAFGRELRKRAVEGITMRDQGRYRDGWRGVRLLSEQERGEGIESEAARDAA